VWPLRQLDHANELAIDVDVVAAVQLVPSEETDAAAGRTVVAKIDRRFPDGPEACPRHFASTCVEDLDDRVELGAETIGHHLDDELLALACRHSKNIGVR